MSRKYNFVIFGGSAITGRFLILEINRFLRSANTDEKFTFAVAGRSATKMGEVLQQVSKMTGNTDLLKIDKIVADVDDENSLLEMARSCDIILNCVGPYILYGEQVVKACVQEGTHHLDLSSEDCFLEYIQLKYNKPAQVTGSLIIGATGFGSIGSDFGTAYLEENFDGVLDTVQSYTDVLDVYEPQEFFNGTYSSIVLALQQFPTSWDHLYPESYYNFSNKLSTRCVQYSPEVESWCVPVVLPDSRTMQRTQRYKYHELKARPVQTQVLATTHNFIMALAVYLFSAIFMYVVRFKVVCDFILKHPKLFTFGLAKTKLPENNSGKTFTTTVVAKGWDKLSKPDGPHNKTLTLKVKGINAATESTAKFMLQAGITVLKERTQLPFRGGVYTPGIIFAGTKLAERLNRNGIEFVLSNPTCIPTKNSA